MSELLLCLREDVCLIVFHFQFYFYTQKGKSINYLSWNKLSRNEVYNTEPQSSENNIFHPEMIQCEWVDNKSLVLAHEWSIYRCLFSLSKSPTRVYGWQRHKWETCSQRPGGFVMKLFYINKRDTENGNYIIFSAVLKGKVKLTP